jgi:ribosomal protein L5
MQLTARDLRRSFRLGPRKIDVLRGLNISITTTAKTDEECRALLTSFKFPFKT